MESVMESEGSTSTGRDRWPVDEKVQNLLVEQVTESVARARALNLSICPKTFDCVRSQEKLTPTAMERDLGVCNKVEIRMLFRHMVFDANSDANFEEKLGQKLESEVVLSRLIEGRSILNLNGVLRLFSKAERRSALAVVFRVVESSSIHTLLLQDNNISTKSLRGAIIDVKAHCASKLSNITVLDLAGNKIKKCNFGERFFGGLKSLSLSRNPIRHGTMPSLADWRGRFPYLETLHLQSISNAVSCRLGGRDKTSILPFREIDLSNNTLEIEAIDALLGNKWPKLKRLVLRNTNIGVKVCTLIASAIGAGKLEALESIDLSYNPAIGDEGVCALASSFQRSCVPNLREICISRTGIGNLGVIKIADAISAGGLKFLETMDLSMNPFIEDVSIVALATSFGTDQAPRMKQFCLSSSGLGDEGVLKIAEAVEIGSFRCLEKLDLSINERVTEESIVALVASFNTRQVLQMRELILAGTKLGSDSIMKLAEAVISGNLRSLKKVDLSCADCSDIPMTYLVSALSSAKQVEELVFANTGMGGGAAFELAHRIDVGSFTSLTKLDLSHNTRISESHLAVLVSYFKRGEVTCLRELLLESAGLGDVGLIRLAEAINSGGLEFLEKLDLSGNKSLTGLWLASLAGAFGSGKAKRFKELVLKDMGWGNTGFIQLVRSGVLSYPERLVLSKSDLKEVLLADIGLQDEEFIDFLRTIGSDNVRSIGKLDLSGNGTITDESLASLEFCFDKEQESCLAQLLLARTGLRGHDIIGLARSIKSGALKNLEKLDLSGNPLSWRSLQALGESLTAPMNTVQKSKGKEGNKGTTTQFKELLLSSCGVGAGFVSDLARAINEGRLKHLQKLDLSRNEKIADIDIVSLLEYSFGKCQTLDLRELNLSRTGVGNATVLQLARVIDSGSLGSLEKLDLSENIGVTDEAMVALGVSLASSQAKCLKELNLSLTGVGDEGVMKLTEALSSGRVISLELLNLSGCPRITDKSWAFLVAFLPHGRATHLKVVTDVRKLTEPKKEFTRLEVHKASPTRTNIPPSGITVPVKPEILESEHVRQSHAHMSRTQAVAEEIYVENEWAEGLFEENSWSALSENHVFDEEARCGGIFDENLFEGEDSFQSYKGTLGETLWKKDTKRKSQAPEVFWDRVGFGTKSFDLQDLQYNNETSFTPGSLDFKGDVSNSMDTMPMTQEQEENAGGSQLRSDIQLLGFRYWDQQVFNPQQILLLCDVKTSAPNAHVIFFHVEAMASLIGVGVPCSKISICSEQDAKLNIVVQEMTKTSWEKLWTEPYDGSFKPIIFERREDASVVSKHNMLYLTKDEALASFGVSMDTTGYQQFMKLDEPLDEPSSPGCKESISFQPRCLSWFENLMDHVKNMQLHHDGEQYDSGSSSRKDCDGRGTGDAEPLQRSGEGSKQSGSRKRKHVSRELGSQGEQAAPTSDVKENVERTKEHKSLIIKVIFLSTATFYKHDSVTRQMNEVQLTDAYPDPHMSSIEPDLTVEFFCASDRFQNVNRMSTTLKAKYQFEGDDDDRLGWYQDLLKLSFQCGENVDFRFGHQGQGSQGGIGFEESASAGSHPQPSRQEGTSLLDSRQDGNTPQASRQDGNTPQASRQDGNTPQASRQDGNTPQASWQDGNIPQASRQAGNALQASRQDGNTPQASRQAGNTLQASRQDGNTPQASRQAGNTLQASRQDGNTPQASRQDGNTSQALREDPYAPQASEQDGNTFHASRQNGNTLQASRLEGGTSQVSRQVRANSPALRQERTNPQTSHQGGSTPHGSRQEAQEGQEGPNLVASVLEETNSPTSRHGRAIPQAETTAGALDNQSEPSCYLEKHQVVSQTEPVELEASNISGKQWSSIDETKFDGSLQWSALLLSLIPNFSGSKRRERNHTSNNGCTTAYKLKSICLSSHPAFAITPVCKRQMLAYKAESLIEPSDSVRRQIKSTGLYSDVEVEVEGKWFLFGTAMKKYEFKAQKKLCKSIIVGGAGDTNEVSVAGDGTAATRNNNITIATNDAGDGELWQIFKRTLLLNHDFSQFYERFQRRNRYTWFLKDSSGYKGPIAPVLTVSD